LDKGITQSNFTYIEPFVGSGAVLFWMLKNFPNLEKAVINNIMGDYIRRTDSAVWPFNRLIYF
jgi:DNA adenine methylase